MAVVPLVPPVVTFRTSLPSDSDTAATVMLALVGCKFDKPVDELIDPAGIVLLNVPNWTGVAVVTAT